MHGVIPDFVSNLALCDLPFIWTITSRSMWISGAVFPGGGSPLGGKKSDSMWLGPRQSHTAFNRGVKDVA